MAAIAAGKHVCRRRSSVGEEAGQINILMMTATFFPSGQTTHVVSLAEVLRRQGHHVDLVLTAPRAQPSYSRLYTERLMGAGVRVTVTRDPSKIHGLIKARRAQVIHAQAAPDFRLARSLARNAGLPYILTCHGLGLNEPRYTDAMGDAYLVVCVGPRIAAHLVRYREKMRVMQNAVDLARFHPVEANTPERPLRIVYAGRFDPQKRAGLRALGEAVDALPFDCEFLVASTPGASNHAGRRRQDIGWKLDTDTLMNTADVVIGTGRAVREGMASGCACLVLGWSYDGIVTPESLGDGSFPDFSGRRSHPTPPSAIAIYEDLKTLAGDRNYLQELQLFSRRYAESNFDLEASARALVTYYQEAAAAFDRA